MKLSQGFPVHLNNMVASLCMKKRKSQTENRRELSKSNMNISRDIENGFQTSTPTYKRKILLCLGSCSANDLCANCIVKEMLQKGEINLEGSFCY